MEKPENFNEESSGISPLGLAYDYANAWTLPSIAFSLSGSPEDEKLWKILAMEPEVKTHEERYGKGASIIKASNPESVAKMDALVREYNAAITGIIERRDRAALLNFARRAHGLITGESKKS